MFKFLVFNYYQNKNKTFEKNKKTKKNIYIELK